MKTRLLYWLELLSANFWMIPLLCLLLAGMLALTTISLDRTLFDNQPESFNVLWYFNDHENIRTLLSAVASSVLSVATVTFSITIASLTLASQQFGPRLLRNFMQDTFNQVVMGLFVGTFLYCLLLLQFTTAMETQHFVPIISMLTVLVLAAISLIMLVFFIHHTATAIQVDSVITNVAQELDNRLHSLFPKERDITGYTTDCQLPEDLQQQFESEGKSIPSLYSGYVQALDQEGLMAYCCEHDIAMTLDYRPGNFVIKQSRLAFVLSKQTITSEMIEAINGFFFLGNVRTAGQDAEYAIRQLSEVAMRALSPGINDPITAISCIDRLGNAMAFMLNRQIPSAHYFDGKGCLRLQCKAFTFQGMLQAAFNEIRQNGSGHVDVVIRLLEVFYYLAEQAKDSHQAQAIAQQVQAVYSQCQPGNLTTLDATAVEERYHLVHQALSKWQSQLHIHL